MKKYKLVQLRTRTAKNQLKLFSYLKKIKFNQYQTKNHAKITPMTAIPPLQLGSRKGSRCETRGIKNNFVIKKKQKTQEREENLVHDHYELQRLMSINSLQHLEIDDMSLSESPAPEEAPIFILNNDSITRSSRSQSRQSTLRRSLSTSLSLQLHLNNDSNHVADTPVFHVTIPLNDMIEEDGF